MPRPNPGPRLKWLSKRESWYIVWYEAGRERVRATGTADDRQAQEAFADFLRERQRDARPDRPRDPDQVLIADALDTYAAEHAPHTADPERIAYALDALLPFWGDKPVDAVTKAACRAYDKARARAPATVRRELATLRAALRYAVQEGRLTRAPHVLLPDKPPGRDRWLTRDEAARLLNEARTGYANVRLYLPLYILLGLYTGARPAAILSLRWPQVDLERGLIDFRAPGERRTTKRRAHIRLPNGLLAHLRRARRRGTDLGHVIHDGGKQIRDIGGGWSGGARRGHGSFGGACQRAGLIGVTPHTLRHTCATWQAQAGVPLHEIGGWLAQSYTTTVELYAHHSPDHQEASRAALEGRNRRGSKRGSADMTRTKQVGAGEDAG